MRRPSSKRGLNPGVNERGKVRRCAPARLFLLERNDKKLEGQARYFLLLFGLCLPVWVIGAIFDIELFPGFKLFQAGLAMPMIASLLLTYRERRWSGITALLRRTYDVVNIKPRIWFLPIFLVYPSLGFINYWTLRGAGADIPSPTFSLVGFLGYCTVFFMTFGEELGLSGYAIDPMQERYSALATGLLDEADAGDFDVVGQCFAHVVDRQRGD